MNSISAISSTTAIDTAPSSRVLYCAKESPSDSATPLYLGSRLSSCDSAVIVSQAALNLSQWWRGSKSLLRSQL